MRSCADRGSASQLALPPRSPDRCLRSDLEPVHRVVTPPGLRMPAEWEPHRATWISWPHYEPDWPGKLGPIPWVYAEIARVIAAHEPLEILCATEAVRASAEHALTAHGVRLNNVRLHIVPTDRVWLRDSAPTGVIDANGSV